MKSNECDDSSSDSIKKIKIKDEVAEIDADNEFEFSRDFISEYVPQSRLFSLLIKKPSLKEFEDDYTAPTLPINNNNIFKTKKWNILDKYFYLWVFQVLFTGYNRLFQPVDLYKLPPDLENDVMYTKFKQNWESALKTYGHSAKSKWLLIKALEKTFRTTLLYCISTYTVSNISQSVMPVVSKKLNIFVENRNNPNVPDPHIGTGIAYTIILALLMVIGIASFCQGYYTSNAIGVYLRSVLSRAILEKVMVLSDESESKISKNRVTAVGSTDLSRIEYGCSLIPYIFGFPVSLVIVVALLIKNVGPVTLVGCAYFLFSLLLSGWGFKKMFDLRIVSNKSTDARVSYIREAVSNLKMIKYFTYERAYEKIINEKRNSEIEIVKKMQYIQSIIQSHGLLAPILGSLFTFLIAFKINPNRSPSSVFAALALFNILSNQMLYVPNCIGTFINMFLSFNRIQEILLGKEGKPKMLELTDKRNAIELKNVSVSYGSRHILDNISLSILRKEFVTILGPTGSGKSTLLSTMTFDGFILCSTPWIQSTTIKLNILFGLPYVECIYKDVIYACALLPDLKAFTAGDRTELGEAGITLSGGQKARVALARACYKALYTQYTNSNSNIVILLDDVMSALDAKSGLHVLEEAILKLLKDCTVLLVTHQINPVAKADRVIYVKGDSTVKLDNLRELLQNNDFKQFYDSCSQENTHDEKEDDENLGTAEKLHLKKIQTIMSQQNNDKDDLEKGRIVTEENRATNSFGLQVYVNFIKAAVGKHWATFLAFAFTIGCITAFFSLFPSVWLSFWVEDKFGKPRSFYMGLYSLWAILFFVFISIELVTIATACITSSKNLHQKSLHNILYTPMSFLDVTPIGRIINRFTKDIDAMDNQMPYVAVFGVYLLFQICAVLIMCAIYIPWFLIAIPFLVLALMFIYSLYQCTGREIKRIEAVQRSLVFNNFNETLNGVETIKNYKVEKLFIRKHDILTDKNNQASFLYFCLQRWSSTWIVNLCAVFSIIISLLCIFKVFKVSASTVGLLLTYVIQLSLTLKALLFEISRIENYMNSVERLVEYANDLPQEKPYILPNSNVGNSWPKDGSLNFENCCMSYRPELPLALKNFSLTVNAGEKVGIVGRSGAGKSTLTSCIFRLTELNSGKISIDGVNIAKIGLLKLRENLAIIPQDPVLFKGTIRANLDPFGNFSDDYLWDVLGKSVYEYDEMLLAKKENNVDDKFHLDHMVEVNGSNYSNGERQMLALARVLIKQNLKILILDEATSQVDLELDLKITNKIFTTLKNSTIITIAHRLRSILKYDKILVMDNGEMKEYGKPLDLFMAEGSIFQELCAKSKIRRSEF